MGWGKWDSIFRVNGWINCLNLSLCLSLPPMSLLLSLPRLHWFLRFHIRLPIGWGWCQLTNERAYECKQYVTTTTTAASSAAAVKCSQTDLKRGKWKKREKENLFLTLRNKLSVRALFPLSCTVCACVCVCVCVWVCERANSTWQICIWRERGLVKY